MKRLFFIAICGMLTYSANSASAAEVNLKTRRMVTLNNAVRCPKAEVDECKVTVTADDEGVITITVTGAMTVPVENPTPSTDVQVIADAIASILDAEGEVPVDQQP